MQGGADGEGIGAERAVVEGVVGRSEEEVGAERVAQLGGRCWRRKIVNFRVLMN